MSLASALFSVHYHAAKLRKDFGFGPWASKATRMEADGSRAGMLPGILPLGDAVEALSAACDGAGEAEKVHAAAVLAQGRWLARRSGDVRADPFDAGIRRITRAPADASLDALSTPDSVFASVHDRLASQEPSSYRILLAEVDAFGVSRFEAEVVGAAREPGVDAYARQADPRCWSLRCPSTFAKSYRTHESRLADPSRAPDGDGAPFEPGESWAGHLFEHANFAGLTEFRNILNIDFRVDRAKNTVGLEYSLYECLSSSVWGANRQGGIDVDSGRGSVAVASGLVRMRASKNVRFATPAPFAAELNALALPFLSYWLGALLVTSTA